jgi:selenocysteine lyase/cysteine desulfurase
MAPWVPAEEVRKALAGRGVNVSVSRESSSRFDLPERGLAEAVRASLHYYNTDEELERLTAALPAARPAAARADGKVPYTL